MMPEADRQAAWAAMARITAPLHDEMLAALADIRTVQERYLKRLIHDNASTVFGKDHNFQRIDGYGAYASGIPATDYEDYQPYIDAIASGAPNVLTAENVEFFEETGGSSGGSKRIPYTRSALDDFGAALLPWLDDLMRGRPAVRSGRVYFALSPAGRSGKEKIGAVKLGSPDGFSYFGKAGEHLQNLSAVPAKITAVTDLEKWQFTTCINLLAAGDLTLVSIWSPTYLTELLRIMMKQRAAIVEAIACGHDVELAHGSERLVTASNPKRARLVEACLKTSDIDTARLWPGLDTISCWLDATSLPFGAELRARFPNVNFQAKGLMSTEAAISFPLCGADGSLLAVNSNFYEFVDDDGATKRAWEVEAGCSYQLLVSNRSGFYRYDTGDIVEIVGFTQSVPRLRFLGRVGLVSDLCGEKLTEEFVLRCFQRCGVDKKTFAFLMPLHSPKPHYELMVDSATAETGLHAVAAALDRALRDNPQYRYARDIGQLDPVKVTTIPDLFERFRHLSLSQGRQLSTLKAPALVREPIRELVPLCF